MNQPFDPIARIEESFLRSIQPVDHPPLSQWADQHFRIPEPNPNAGPWKTIPYQRKILDSFTDPRVEFLTIKASARVGKTLMPMVATVYCVGEDPTEIAWVQPTKEHAEGFSKEDLMPALLDCEKTAHFFEGLGLRSSSNTMKTKKGPGWSLRILSAHTGTDFRRIQSKWFIFDETDAYPASAGREGNVIKLGIKRTEQYRNRKIVRISTPKLSGTSLIDEAYAESDQQRFAVPCPECEFFQPFEFAQFHWEKRKPETVRYVCKSCGSMITPDQKYWMIDRGDWEAAAAFTNHAGFALWSAYSYAPNATWEHIAEEAIKAADAKKTGDIEQVQTWVNLWLGESFNPAPTKTLDEETIKGRCEEYGFDPLPEGVLLITAMADVQKNRIEVEIVGWGRGEESWGLDYVVLEGDTLKDPVWEDLEQEFSRSFFTAGGAELPIASALVDMGYRADEVYAFTKPREVRRIYASQGQKDPGKPLVGRLSYNNDHEAAIVPIGTEAAKDIIAARLELEEAGPGYCHMPTRYPPEYFEMLTSEEAVDTFRKGHPVRIWRLRKGRKRNESLDCRVGAFVAMRRLRPSWDRIAENIEAREAKSSETESPAKTEQKAPKGTRRRRSSRSFSKRWT